MVQSESKQTSPNYLERYYNELCTDDNEAPITASAPCVGGLAIYPPFIWNFLRGRPDAATINLLGKLNITLDGSSIADVKDVQSVIKMMDDCYRIAVEEWRSRQDGASWVDLSGCEMDWAEIDSSIDAYMATVPLEDILV